MKGEEADHEEIPMTDERVQKTFDEQLLYTMLADARRGLAQSKLNKLLAQRGLLEKEQNYHPNKFNEPIAECRRLVDQLCIEIDCLTETGILETSLDVASSVP